MAMHQNRRAGTEPGDPFSFVTKEGREKKVKLLEPTTSKDQDCRLDSSGHLQACQEHLDCIWLGYGRTQVLGVLSPWNFIHLCVQGTAWVRSCAYLSRSDTEKSVNTICYSRAVKF